MFGNRDRLLRARLREEFVITMQDGSAWRGILYSADEHTIVLRDAAAMSDSLRGPVDGELLLPRARIDYMQRP